MVLMLAMTVMAAGSALLAPVFGSLMDKTSLRRLMVLGGVLLALGYAALSFATSFVQVLAIYALVLAPANVLIGPMAATVLLSRWFVQHRGRAIGFAIAGIAVGGIVFPPLIQWLLDAHAWRGALRLFALVMLLCAVPAAALAVNSPADRGLHPDGAAEDPGRLRQGAETQRISAGAVLADPTFWLAAAVFAVVLSGMKGMVTNLAPLAIDAGVPASRAAWLISVYSACGFVAKLGFAAVADRLSPRTLMFVSLGGFAAGIACLTQAHLGFGAIALGVGLIGLFGGLMVPMQSLLVPRIFGDRAVGRAMGLISMVTLCALLATPPLFGLIFDLTGNYSAIFVTFAALAAGAMLIVPSIRLTPRAGAAAHDREKPTGAALARKARPL
jgi:MFS family permease